MRATVAALTAVLLVCAACDGTEESRSTAGTPRLIAYYNSATDPPLEGVADGDYTHVILAFLVADSAGRLEPSDELQAALLAAGAIREAQAAGKGVMVSVGGATVDADTWLAWGQDAESTAQEIVAVIDEHGLDGVDLDVENLPYSHESDFAKYADAVVDLTNALDAALPDALISHAPQPPYLCEPGTEGCPGDSLYAYILNDAGDAIDWLNMQYYSNAPITSSDASELTSYRSIVEGWDGFPGLASERLVVGKPYSSGIPGFEDVGSVVDGLLGPLYGDYGAAFGGFMGWEYSEDDGTWASRIAEALGLGDRSSEGS